MAPVSAHSSNAPPTVRETQILVMVLFLGKKEGNEKDVILNRVVHGFRHFNFTVVQQRRSEASKSLDGNDCFGDM